MTESSTHKRKILYVITKSNWGGAQRYVYDLATGVQGNGFEPVVALGGNGVLTEKLHVRGIRTVTIAHFERDIGIIREYKAFRELLGVIREERPDILHVNSSKAGGIGALAGRIAHVPRIIFTAHGWYFLERRHAYIRFITRFLSWLTALLSHRVILVSERDREAGSWMPFVQKKFIVIHNGIGGITFLERGAARQALQSHIHGPLSRTTPWIGTIAELHPNKGLIYALEAMALVREAGQNALLAIIGEGELKKSLTQEIQKRRLEDSVFLLGHIDNAATYLKAFNLYILPSLKEGLPYVLLEAGAAGLPIIATDVGGVREVIDDMSSGILIKPGSARQLADALILLLKHTTRQEELGAHLQKKIREEFLFSTMYEHTLRLYQ